MSDQKQACTQLYEETYDDILKYIVTHCSNLEDANEIQDLISDDTNLEQQALMNLEVEEIWSHLKQKKQIIQNWRTLYEMQ